MNGDKSALRAKYPPPGEMVDMGGYRLHLACEGTGGPTVVLEAAGLGDFSLGWALVQPEVARFTRVCAYDRAGYGWSDASPNPRNAGVMVEELRALLTAARVPGPYVLVGHSYGGLLVRYFAHRHPADVAGMVLVDSAHEEQFLRFPQSVRNAYQPMQDMQFQQLETVKGLMASGSLDPAVLPVPAKLPEATIRLYRDLSAADTVWVDTMAAEMRALDESHAQVRAARIQSLGDIPLVVLSHGQPLPPFPPQLNVSEKDMEQYERTWQQLQVELTGLSPRGLRILAQQSGHMIQHDEPELVVDAIRQVVTAARS